MSSRKRIVFLIQGFSDGGAQKQCIYLLNELQKHDDMEMYLVHFYPGVHDALLERDRLNVVKLDVSSNYDPRNVLRLAALLREINPSTVVTWLHACDVYGYFIRWMIPGLRWIMTERDSNYPCEVRYLLRRMLGRSADVIVANSEQGAAYWKSLGYQGLLRVIPNIVRRQRLLGERSGDKRVFSIGRLESQKNPKTVVCAFSQLAVSRPDIEFAVVGDGSKRIELIDLASKGGPPHRVSFLGFRSDLEEILRSASLVVSMSHHEGSPNVLLECIAMNVPVVVSDIPEHRALLGPGYPYYVKDRLDPNSVVITIEKAIEDKDSTEYLSYAKGLVEQMSPANVTEMYVDLFRQVAD